VVRVDRHAVEVVTVQRWCLQRNGPLLLVRCELRRVSLSGKLQSWRLQKFSCLDNAGSSSDGTLARYRRKLDSRPIKKTPSDAFQ
jgi:hypothetical protein